MKFWKKVLWIWNNKKSKEINWKKLKNYFLFFGYSNVMRKIKNENNYFYFLNFLLKLEVLENV